MDLNRMFYLFMNLLVVGIALGIELTTPVFPNNGLSILEGISQVIPDFSQVLQPHRSIRQVDTSEPDILKEEQRFLPFLSSKLTSCNYPSQSGASCLNCRQTLFCMQGNVGIVKSCFFPLNYCNKGHCSINPGPQCSVTSTSTSSTTTLASTTITTPPTTAATTTLASTTTAATTVVPTTSAVATIASTTSAGTTVAPSTSAVTTTTSTT